MKRVPNVGWHITFGATRSPTMELSFFAFLVLVTRQQVRESYSVDAFTLGRRALGTHLP